MTGEEVTVIGFIIASVVIFGTTEWLWWMRKETN